MATPTNNCTIARPDPQELWDRIAARFSATVLGGGEIIPESNEWYVTSLNYAMAEEFYAYADQLAKENDPRTACCDNLVAMAANWGLYPKAASFSEGYVMLRGQPDAQLVDPMQIQAAGKTYRTTGAVPARLNSSGQAIVRFRALEAGPASNLLAVTSGYLSPVPAGVNRMVSIFGGQFCGGALEETCEQFRQRYISRMSYRPRATRDWLVEKLLEWPCVTRVCDRGGECCVEGDNCDECNCANCRDNVNNGFYVMFDNTFPCGAAPQCVLDEIQTWLFGPEGRQGRGIGQAPIGVCGKLHALTIARFDLNIDVQACLSASQTAAVEEALRGYMSSICPSTEITLQALAVVVGQVVGASTNFEIASNIVNPNYLGTDACGTLVPRCDVLPCLRNISFSGPTQEDMLCL